MFVYLDNSSTTRQYNEVTKIMLSTMDENYGNPSSMHRMGLLAETAVKKARKSVATSLGVMEEEITFTSCGTEADNTAILGAAQARKRKGNKIITSQVEHPAVLEVCKKCERMGFQVDYIKVDEKGLVDQKELEQRLDDSTILVSIMAVNNELGTVEPIWEIGRMTKEKGDILFHTDGIQAFGKIDLNIENVDLLSLSGHKIHGPKGTGALYIKKGIHMEPYLLGGGQEKGFRSGTENTPGLAGFGLAADIISRTKENRIKKLEQVRHYLLNGIREEIRDIVINSPEFVYEPSNGCGPVCSPAILNISFLGCRGQVLLHTLEQRDIYVSTGSACSSRKKGSHVLVAAGLAPSKIESAIRFSFSEFNTIEEMDYVVFELKKAVTGMRKLRKQR
ncbi:MAG: cysteine desulfurase family protein [Eubacteriales bacterium]|nr:cysteine desulfurase family protein [Eubacteriales bacterium]